jgi:hypothetical protein
MLCLASRQRFKEAVPRARQRGWIGLLVVLVALLIVAWLAQGALKQYGLLGATPAAKPGAAAKASSDQPATPPTPMNAMERARGVEQTVQQGADEQSRRIDEQTK